MKKVLTIIVISLLCVSTFSILTPKVMGWASSLPSSLHEDMALDALSDTGWSLSDRQWIASWAWKPDDLDLDPGEVDLFDGRGTAMHRVTYYQRELEIYNGMRARNEEKPGLGAEFMARDFIMTARDFYAADPNSAEARRDLGLAIHFIQDAVCPPHVFPFSEDQASWWPPGWVSDVTPPSWNFEEETANEYFDKNWPSLVRTAETTHIANIEDLKTKIVEAADRVYALPCSYVRQNDHQFADSDDIIGNPEHWHGWDMSDENIGKCMVEAAKLVKGAAIYVLAPPLMTISGWIQHNNEAGTLVDSRYIKVEAWEKEALFDYKFAEGYTNDVGRFEFALDINGGPILNEDPGLFESGTRDIYIKYFAENEAARVSNNWISDIVHPILGGTYWGQTPVDYDVMGPVWNIYASATSEHSAALGIPGVIKADRDWLSSATGGWKRDQIGVLYPDSNWPGFFGPNWLYDVIKIPEWEPLGSSIANHAYWDANTISHEYGHAVHYSARGGGLPDTNPAPTGEEDPPGTGIHWIFSESSGGFALTEGWAQFFEYARHGENPDLRLETNDYWMGADGNGANGPNTDGTTGEIVEGAFASILWDLYDGANDDGVNVGFSNPWTVFLNDDPDLVWSSSANDDFYHYWTSRYGQTRAVDEIFIDHGIPVTDDSYDSGTGNDNSATASNLGTIDISRRVEDLITVDIDWYRFTTSVQGNVDSEVAIEFDKSRGDLDLFVYRSDGTLVGAGIEVVGGKRVSLNGRNSDTFKIRVVGTGDNSATSGIYEGDFSPNYDLKIALRGRSSGPDSFGYTFIDSNKQGGPGYDWVEISGTGTRILPSSDDQWVANINLGFFFNYYGTDYSRLAIGNNGLLFSGAGTSQWTNQPITQTPSIHGFIAPYWDDIVTWGSADAIYYQTLGTAPNRRFVVEWHDNQHYSSSPSGITFEAILYEGTNNMLFQYQDVDFGISSYNNGGSATVGIEGPTGNIGLQYSINEQVITPGLAILFKFPAFAGTNMYLSMNAPASMDRGSSMTYTLYYNDFGDVAASDVVLQAMLSTNVNFVYASDGGTYNSATRRVTWNIGTVPAFPQGRGLRTVAVIIPSSVPIGTVIQTTASITTSTLETRYDDNSAPAQTTVTGSSLPPNVGVGPVLGNPGGTPSVYWTTPITFTYSDPAATGVSIRIHFDSGGTDITGSMTGGPPLWSYTTTFYPRSGHATVAYTVHYPSGDSQVNFGIYVDPAGYIYDIVTLERIAGASVWLQRPDAQGGWENVPTGQTPSIMQPDANPQITGTDGQYQWDVLAGSYRVHVEAPGYYPADSIMVVIPPPVTDLHVGLTPLPPPPDPIPPTTVLTIGDPKYTDTSGNVFVVSDTPFTLTAEDNAGGSGLAATGYRIRNATYDSGWIASAPPIEFYLTGLADGLYFIDYNSTDNVGNVESLQTYSTTLDNSGPLITVENPPAGWALQNGVTFIASASDSSGTHSLNFSIREANGGQGIPVGFEDIPATYDAIAGRWNWYFNTLQLPDGYYIVLVNAEDNLGHATSTTVPYSIRNWAVLELLPASENNKAGRTMPVKFALRVAASVDPDQPFVYNQELTIKIYAKDNPSNVLQTSTYGTTSKDYRIIAASELYITNFQTLKTPKTCMVEIWRKDMLIGNFEFKTVK